MPKGGRQEARRGKGRKVRGKVSRGRSTGQGKGLPGVGPGVGVHKISYCVVTSIAGSLWGVHSRT